MTPQGRAAEARSDVNLTGTWLVAQAVLPHMLDRGGVILNTASTSGLFAQPWQAAYCASKGGVVMLTKALALEYLGRKLRVNAIAPGGVETPIMADFSQLPEGGELKRILRYVSADRTSPSRRIISVALRLHGLRMQRPTTADRLWWVLMDGGMTL